MAGVRTPMPVRRQALAQMAFKHMDKEGNGMLDASDVCHNYDASKHPDVLAGRMTTDQAFRAFLDNFDVGGTHDGKVTDKEFFTYYENVSISIDDDDYFELMIRNAWHLSGGEGWSANTFNNQAPQGG